MWGQYVNVFVDDTVEELHLDVKVKYLPSWMSCQGNNILQNVPFYHRCKSVIVVNAFLLLRAFGNWPSLDLDRSSVSVGFHPINPLWSDDLLGGWESEQIPCVILVDGFQFTSHCCLSSRMLKCFVNTHYKETGVEMTTSCQKNVQDDKWRSLYPDFVISDSNKFLCQCSCQFQG
jgi:hypothetical protein